MVMEESKPESQLSIPISDNYSISKEMLDIYFPLGSGLKYKLPHSDIYHV
jgi:hypothetical protein